MRNLLHWTKRRHENLRQSRPPSWRPSLTLETLEDRTVPSTAPVLGSLPTGPALGNLPALAARLAEVAPLRCPAQAWCLHLSHFFQTHFCPFGSLAPINRMA